MALDVCNFCDRENQAFAGKFVIFRRIYGEGDGYVVVSDLSLGSQHSDIVARWQRERKVLLSDVGLTVTGGGMWRLIDDGKTLVLFGKSLAYGGFDPSLPEEIIPGSVFDEEHVVLGGLLKKSKQTAVCFPLKVQLG